MVQRGRLDESSKQRTSSAAVTRDLADTSPKEGLGIRKVTNVMALVTVGCFPLEGIQLGPQSVTFWATSAFLMCVALSMASAPISRPKGVNAPILIAFLLVGIALISTFWSFSVGDTLRSTAILLFLVVTAVALSLYLPELRVPTLVVYSVGASFLALQILAAPPDQASLRSTALGNANDVGMACAIAVMFTLFLVSEVSWGFRLVLLVPLLINCFGLVATGSRTATIALAVGVIAFLSQLLFQRRLLAAGSIFALIAAMASFAALRAPQAIVERITLSGQTLDNLDLSEREVIWDVALSSTPELAGYGFGAVPAWLASYFGADYAVHNGPLEIWLELGVFGVCCFGLLVITTIWVARRSAFRSVMIPLWSMVLLSSLTLSVELRRSFWIAIVLSWSVPPIFAAAKNVRRTTSQDSYRLEHDQSEANP